MMPNCDCLIDSLLMKFHFFAPFSLVAAIRVVITCYKGSQPIWRYIIIAKQVSDFKGLVPTFFKKKKRPLPQFLYYVNIIGDIYMFAFIFKNLIYKKFKVFLCQFHSCLTRHVHGTVLLQSANTRRALPSSLQTTKPKGVLSRRGHQTSCSFLIGSLGLYMHLALLSSWLRTQTLILLLDPWCCRACGHTLACSLATLPLSSQLIMFLQERDFISQNLAANS